MQDAFDSEDYIFELKLDGIRCIAYLDKDSTDLRRLVQETIYGEDLRVVDNFSGKEYKKDGEVISPKSLMIYDGADKMEYNYSKEY